MFTGIIETIGKIKEIEIKGTNHSFWIESDFSHQLKIDQSVAHSGVCLTVEEVNDNAHCVTAILETLEKTNLSTLKKGSLINLERCLKLDGRLDGHLVQGHVDCTATCIEKLDKDGSWIFSFQFPAKFGALVIEKGSICLNGTSLTIFNVGVDEFSVAIIPYTYDNTNIKEVEKGDLVNVEFDMIGKYVNRIQELKIPTL